MESAALLKAKQVEFIGRLMEEDRLRVEKDLLDRRMKIAEEVLYREEKREKRKKQKKTVKNNDDEFNEYVYTDYDD